MKTIIRLANHGIKKRPYWWIVVQTSGAKSTGKSHERLGFWFPHKQEERSRSVVLNKHRARFWIHSGAHLSPRIHSLFNLAGLMPPRWVPNGRCTVPKTKRKISEYVEGINAVETLSPHVFRKNLARL